MDPTTIDWHLFGTLIRSRRIELAFSQADIARELGISQPSVSFTERGNPIGLTDERILQLLNLLRIAESEVPLIAPPKVDANKKMVFLSYSHRDGDFLNRLLVHLRPLQKKGLIDTWSDRRITGGQEWKTEIEKALQNAAYALLLVSADFLASDFIVDNELPPLLSNAKEKGTIILPIILKPCRFSREDSLSRYQALNAPDDPLSGMEEHEREMVYDSAAAQIERLALTK